MTSKGYHSLNLQVSDKNLVTELQKIAESFGYIQTRGGGKGRGSISQLVEAIARGEVKVSRGGANESKVLHLQEHSPLQADKNRDILSGVT